MYITFAAKKIEMEINWIQQIQTYFRNLVLGTVGTKRTLHEYLEKGNVGAALSLLVNRDKDVDKALREYNPELHDVMNRRNKAIEGDSPYITEKLPRRREVYINEIELAFLLGNPIKWKKAEGDDDAYKLFLDYLKNTYFNSKIRRCKRYAGAETMSAILFHFHRTDGGKIGVDEFVAARQTGYRIRYMHDHYGNLQVLAVGYYINDGRRTREKWDILTAEMNYECINAGITLGWDVQRYPNPTGKINGILFLQEKSWAGPERRMRREEMLDSRVGDVNNYFSDPMAMATADVIENLPNRDKPGKLLQLTGKDSRFEYLNPPQDAATRQSEKKDLNDSILFDTFTPDLSFEKMKGMGTLSGDAIRNSLIIGYIKRANRMDIYEELIARYSHVVIAVLKQLHPEMAEKLDTLKVDFEFSDLFPDKRDELWNGIGSLYSSGVISLETAVQLLSLTDAPDEEIRRIREQKNEEGGNIQPEQ